MALGLLPGPGAKATPVLPAWVLAPGLRLSTPEAAGPGVRAQLISGRTGSATLAKMSLPGRLWRSSQRLVFLLAAWSPRSEGPCLRLHMTATDQRGGRIARLATPYTCLSPSRWTWIGLKTVAPAGAAAIHVLLERRRPVYARIDLLIAGAPRAKQTASRTSPPPPPSPHVPAVTPSPSAPPSPPPATGPAPPARRGPMTRPLVFLPTVYSLKPDLRGKHPRLLLTADALAGYRGLVRGRLAWLAAPLLALAQKYLAEPLPRRPFARPETSRAWGRRPLLLAFCHQVTGDQKYFEAARRWLLAATTWRTWGPDSQRNQGLTAAYLLADLAVAYDWLYPGLPADERRLVERKLVRQADLLHDALIGPGTAWWSRAWRQERLWVSATALGLAGLVLTGDSNQATAWVTTALKIYRRVNTVLPTDGSWPQAASDWSVGVGAMTVFYYILDRATDVDPWPSCPWLARTIRFRLHVSRPDFRAIINFGDGPEHDRIGPRYQLLILARAYHSPVAAWLARRAADTGDAYDLWGFLAADPDLKPAPPDDRPPFALFDDLDLFVVRDSWSPQGVMLALKCGPPGGRLSARARVIGRRVVIGRSHPDQNSLVLFKDGRGLIVDDGFARIKWTRDQNTLLVGGRGQRGEGLEVYHDDRPGQSLKAGLDVVLATPFLTAVQGEAGPMYPRATGLTRYRRLILFLPPDLILVLDRASTATATTFNQRFHFRGLMRRTGDHEYRLQGGDGRPLLAASLFSPEKVTIKLSPDSRRVAGRPVRHTILDAGSASPADRFRLVTVLRPEASSGPWRFRWIKGDGFWGLAWMDQARRFTFLTRDRPGRLTASDLSGRAELLFTARDQAGNFVALGLNGRSLTAAGRPVLESRVPLNWAIMGRSQVLIALVAARRASRLVLNCGFNPERVSVGETVLSASPDWSQGKVSLDLTAGEHLIIVQGPQAPPLPPVLSAAERKRFFLAR